MNPAQKLEAAIPPHLRMERTQDLRAPQDFVPATRSFSSRFSPLVRTLPMVYFGVQHQGDTAKAHEQFSKLRQGFEEPNGPQFWDRAAYVDERGYTNWILVGYWRDHDTYVQWERARAADWWHAAVDIKGSIGLFREAYTPGVEDTETTFSHPHAEGYSHICDHWSEPTDSHDYWGSARDRIARSQVDPLEPSGEVSTNLKVGEDSAGRLVTVWPHNNLCLLRSGQDWSETEADERSFYLQRVEPILNAGMKEIRDEGLDKGCIYNRYMTVATDDGTAIEKTYSLSAWKSLEQIENWVRQKTHLAIYHIGVKHYQRVGPDARLRLYHEMFVMRAKDQQYAYFNCHAQTGMLRAVVTKSAGVSGLQMTVEA